MRNLDKYFDELLKDKCVCDLIPDFDEKYEDCYECPFDTDSLLYSCNNEKFKEWLLEEIQEHIKLTLHEKCILESIPDKYNYIARDESGTLYIYNGRPIKNAYAWNTFGEYCGLGIFRNMFKFVKWEDDEPYKIEDILKNCEVVENE